MMEEFFEENDKNLMRVAWMPTVDVKETDKELTFVAELPGLKEEDITVEMVGDMLTIRGEREFSQEEKKDEYVRIERSYGSFQRSFSVDVPVKGDEICAEYKNGLLIVVLPKAEAIVPRKIAINKA
jgi:HSP20 family protein